jgi:exodeoxyribonuclease-3
VKLLSWNVNGLRACLNKGFLESVSRLDADIICLQETKMERGQAEIDLPGYEEYWNSAAKKGYSGTAVLTRPAPLSAAYGIGLEEHDREGRVITLEYPDFYLVDVYTPNSQRELLRLPYRMAWEDAFRAYLQSLDEKKPVVVCGDLNVAHQEIDIKNAKSNRKNAGFTDEERGKMTELLAAGFVDTFRALYPDKRDAYTWWSYYANARERNIGWRIDYFVVSARLWDRVTDAAIHPDIQGSDHCPVGLELAYSAHSPTITPPPSR